MHNPSQRAWPLEAVVRASACRVVAAQVEWYETGGSSATYSAANEYAPYNPAAAQSGAEYGSFDDEPPLLEGGRHGQAQMEHVVCLLRC